MNNITGKWLSLEEASQYIIETKKKKQRRWQEG